MSFWDIVWFIVLGLLLVVYLMLLFSIIADLFRDHELSGWLKALWVFCLIVFPFVTASIYVVTRGSSMAGRSAAAALKRREDEADYIRRVARGDATDPMAEARNLLDDGVITEEEFARIQRRTLG
ncbi:SHOCT domain-containing protein [Nocardia mexicana]|uniref:Phospholipase D-like protein n=1 Tax=Nocardia mexicana TaxID=279262 RepID=A0A370H0W2_9NOCA|nr:SHOCT domain-containing protein [Nocardia mexicana]RDI49675.1 hypothetical protein DFR68_106110 [Nocardia mexicana]